MQKEVVVVSGDRTAIGAFGGSLKDIPVVELGAAVIKEALRRAGLRPKSSEELLSYGPDALKTDGIIELEKKHYDYDSSLDFGLNPARLSASLIIAAQLNNRHTF